MWSVAGAAEGGGEGLLELQPHGEDDLADEVVLGGEVVDDDAIADAEPVGDPAEGQPAEAVVEGDGQGAVEDLLFGVLVAHGG